MVPLVSASLAPHQIPDPLIVQLPGACHQPFPGAVLGTPVTTCPSLIPLAPQTTSFWDQFYRWEEMGDGMWLAEGHRLVRGGAGTQLDLLKPICTLSPCPSASWGLSWRPTSQVPEVRGWGI